MHRTRSVLLSCLLPLAANAETRNWSFVQSVGGMSLGAPVRAGTGWSLPITANVSGLEAITQTPTTLNSALVCERTSAVVEDRNIYLAISTGLVRGKYTVNCPSAQLGQVSAGAYRVFYRGPEHKPVLLGEIQVAP